MDKNLAVFRNDKRQIFTCPRYAVLSNFSSPCNSFNGWICKCNYGTSYVEHYCILKYKDILLNFDINGLTKIDIKEFSIIKNEYFENSNNSKFKLKKTKPKENKKKIVKYNCYDRSGKKEKLSTIEEEFSNKTVRGHQEDEEISFRRFCENASDNSSITSDIDTKYYKQKKKLKKRSFSNLISDEILSDFDDDDDDDDNDDISCITQEPLKKKPKITNDNNNNNNNTVV